MKRKGCGFCQNDLHHKCRGAARNGDGSIVECQCAVCAPSRIHQCLTCGETLSETWECADRAACQARAEAVRENSLLYQQLRDCRRPRARTRRIR